MIGGIIVGFALHLFQIAILLAVGLLYLTSPKEIQNVVVIGFGSPLVIGLSQLVYMIPAYLKFKKGPNPQWAPGVLIAAAITFLLNASCWGMLFNTKWDFK